MLLCCFKRCNKSKESNVLVKKKNAVSVVFDPFDAMHVTIIQTPLRTLALTGLGLFWGEGAGHGKSWPCSARPVLRTNHISRKLQRQPFVKSDKCNVKVTVLYHVLKVAQVDLEAQMQSKHFCDLQHLVLAAILQKCNERCQQPSKVIDM